MGAENLQGTTDTQLLEFIASLTNEERQLMKLELSQKIENYFDSYNRIHLHSIQTEKEFHRLARMLRYLTPFNELIPANGIAYYGRPSWVIPELLNGLQEEAVQRRNQPLDRIDHFLGCGGAIADALSVSPDIVDFVAKHVGKIKPTGIASYLFYDKAGSGIRPHVDTEVFSVNLMLMLKHVGSPTHPFSSTSFFPADMKPEHYWLQVGEVMIMHGSSTIHTRTIVQDQEDIHLLTIGFNRIA